MSKILIAGALDFSKKDAVEFVQYLARRSSSRDMYS